MSPILLGTIFIIILIDAFTIVDYFHAHSSLLFNNIDFQLFYRLLAWQQDVFYSIFCKRLENFRWHHHLFDVDFWRNIDKKSKLIIKSELFDFQIKRGCPNLLL